MYHPGTRSIHLDPLGFLQPIYTWEATGTGRRCSFASGPNAYGDMFRSDARIIAHELGHAFDHDRDGCYSTLEGGERKSTAQWCGRTGGHVETVNPNAAGIPVTSRLIQVGIALVVVGHAAACRADRTTRVSGCPRESDDPVLLSSVVARYAPIEFQLPEGSSHAPEHADAPNRAEAWTGPGGLVVGYSLHPDSVLPAPLGRGSIHCSEKIGGKAADIRLHYSQSTTSAGQYASASWALGSGETLVLGVTHPDSSMRGLLLGIVRSVRFRNSAP